MTSEFKQIISGNLDSASYDAEEELLTVRFKNGTAYRYAGVWPKTYRDFEETFDGENGRSAGRFFSQSIRSAFEYEKLDDWK